MRRPIVATLFGFAAQLHARGSETAEGQLAGGGQGPLSSLTDVSVDELLNKLLQRGHVTLPHLGGAGLESSALGKPGSVSTRSIATAQAQVPLKGALRNPLLAKAGVKSARQFAQQAQLGETRGQRVEVHHVAPTSRPASIPLLGEFGRLWLGQSEFPVARYRPSDLSELFGGALFLTLKRFQEQLGNAYLLPTGPDSSFLVLSDPASAQHILDSYGKYEKGLVRELAQFLFGDGFAVADGAPWKVRRRAVAPSLHKKYLDVMIKNVFAGCSLRTAKVLEGRSQRVVDMEAAFSELTLDIIGKAVFNYDFEAVEADGDSRVIESVYTALKEVETRSIDFLPVWKLPGDIPAMISPRQRKAQDAVALIRKTTEDLIENCRLQVEAEEAAGTAAEFNGEEYVSESDPSVLRFLIASREEVKSSQLRDDLLSMLVAGHETTASVLTWTLYLLTKHPDKMQRVQEEIDGLGSRWAEIEAGDLKLDDLLGLNYLRWCVFESMRLYPHPPVLIRRALEDDYLPNGGFVPKGQDVMISIYNIHHSPEVWSNAEDFLPERWAKFNTPRNSPNERNTDYHYIPFSGGARRCVGDQFALLEAFTAMAVLLRKFDFTLVPGQDIGMTTGATIHTTNGMKMAYTTRVHT